MSTVVADMVRDARISECGLYRYTLDRKWGGPNNYYPMVFIMLNPSTADANIDDPTIRRCIGFAQRERQTAIMVVNLFAYRATSPKDMRAAADPVGPSNDNYLDQIFMQCSLRGHHVVAAWGAHGSHLKRDRAVWALAHKNALDLQCLGVTKDGHPKHPLYLPNDAALVPWRPTKAPSE